MDREYVCEKIKFFAGIIAAFVILGGVIFVSAAQTQWKNSAPTVESFAGTGPVQLVAREKTIWKYSDGGSDPASGENRLSWTLPGFDDSGWKEAAGDFGAKNGERQEFIKGRAPENLLNQYNADGTVVAASFFRTEMILENTEKITQLKGKINYDDSVMVYINGVLVYAGNTPEGGFSSNLEYGSKSGDGKKSSSVLEIDDTSMLRDGRNIIAVELHQGHAGTSDLYLDFESLTAYQDAVKLEELDVSGLILEPEEDEGSIKINWYTSEEGCYEAELAQGTGEFPEVYERRIMGTAFCGEGSYCNTVTFTGLKKDTDYQYRIRRIGSSRRSRSFCFRTGTEDGGFIALAFGDPQIGAGSLEKDGLLWEHALNQAKLAAPAAQLMLSLGDQSDSRTPETMIQEIGKFRQPELLKGVPTAVIQGNHEAEEEVAGIFEKQFERQDADRLGDYSFTWQDTLFVAFNTNDRDYAKQQAFLHQAIEDIKPRWVVVLMHYSIFSSGEHALDRSMGRFREEYSKIMKAENVDLVLSGHDHIYTRSHLMDGMEPVISEEGRKREGETLYLTLGSSTGSKYYDRADAELPYVAFEKQGTACFTRLDIQKERIRIETFSAETGQMVDSYELYK